MLITVLYTEHQQALMKVCLYFAMPALILYHEDVLRAYGHGGPKGFGVIATLVLNWRDASTTREF